MARPKNYKKCENIPCENTFVATPTANDGIERRSQMANVFFTSDSHFFS